MSHVSCEDEEENTAAECASALMCLAQGDSGGSGGAEGKVVREDLETIKNKGYQGSKQGIPMSARYVDPRLTHIISRVNAVNERQTRVDAFTCEESPRLMKQNNLVSMRLTCSNQISSLPLDTDPEKAVVRYHNNRVCKCHSAKCIYLDYEGNITHTKHRLEAEHLLCARCKELQPKPLPSTSRLTPDRVRDAVKVITEAGYDPMPKSVMLIANVEGAADKNEEKKMLLRMLSSIKKAHKRMGAME